MSLSFRNEPGTGRRTPRRRSLDFLPTRESEPTSLANVLRAELTPEIKTAVRQRIEEMHASREYATTSWMVNALHVVAPEECPPTVFTAGLYREIVRLLRIPGAGEEAENQFVCTLGTFFPEKREEYTHLLPKEQDLKSMKEYRERKGEWIDFYERVYYKTMREPESTQQVLDRKTFDGFKEDLKRKLKETRELAQFNEKTEVDGWDRYITSMSYAAILHPDWKNELPLDQEVAEKAQKILHYWREEPQAFIITAAPIAILASQRAEIVAPGQLRITPSMQVDVPQPLPIQQEY